MIIKNFFNQKTVILALIFIALVVTYYFYQEGEISFLPGKKQEQVESEIIEVPFRNKEYKLSYKDKLDSTFNIADFEDNENWFGNGEFDYTTFFEGNSSLFLSSYEHQKAVASLNKRFDISEVLNFKFLVYLETDPANIEELNLIFEGRETYKFPIRDLTTGWNFLILAKKNFSTSTSDSKEILDNEEILDNKDKEILKSKTNIEKVVIELVSRPTTRTIINLDSLWTEMDEEYLNDWNENVPKFLSIKKHKDSGGLLALNLIGSQAVLKQGSGKNYTFQAKFTPMKKGGFGFFLRGDYKTGYGYYLTMGGVDTNSWQITKYGLFDKKAQTVVLVKGEISNFKMEKDKPYWLKAEMKTSKIVFYLSLDGKNFTKLGEARDNSFSGGGIGIFASGVSMFLIDEIQFFQ